MSKVFITQLLCPSRHCVLAAAWSPGGDVTAELVEQGLRGFVTLGALNPWCGLCGSTKLNCETQATIFETLDEAQPFLRASEEAQMLTSRISAQMPKPN